MDGSNGNDGDGNPSPVPHNPERIAILDAGAQYGKVNKWINSFSFLTLMLNHLLYVKIIRLLIDE